MTVNALDQYQNIVPSSYSVILGLSGSALGAGSLQLVSGTVSATIRDHKPETITASLSAASPISGVDYSSSASISFSPGPLPAIYPSFSP